MTKHTARVSDLPLVKGMEDVSIDHVMELIRVVGLLSAKHPTENLPTIIGAATRVVLFSDNNTASLATPEQDRFIVSIQYLMIYLVDSLGGASGETMNAVFGRLHEAHRVAQPFIIACLYHSLHKRIEIDKEADISEKIIKSFREAYQFAPEATKPETIH